MPPSEKRASTRYQVEIDMQVVTSDGQETTGRTLNMSLGGALVRVPLHFVNEDVSVGVKTGGGVVTHAMNDIEIQCLPDRLPEYIEVDLKDVQLNDIIHVNDLKLPEGVEPTQKLKADNPPVASVHVPKVAAAEEEAAAPVTEITGQAPADAAAAAEPEKKEGGK